MACLICKSAMIYTARGKSPRSFVGEGRETEERKCGRQTLRYTEYGGVACGEDPGLEEGMEAMEDLKEAIVWRRRRRLESAKMK